MYVSGHQGHHIQDVKGKWVCEFLPAFAYSKPSFFSLREKRLVYNGQSRAQLLLTVIL